MAASKNDYAIAVCVQNHCTLIISVWFCTQTAKYIQYKYERCVMPRKATH